MALITLATTWCSFQSSKWSGRSDDQSTQAGLLDRKANLLILEGMQVQAVQAQGVMEFIDAKMSGNDELAQFYVDRMGAELKPAFDAWIALKPFENPDAPTHPFVPALYTPRFSNEIEVAREQSTSAQAESERTGAVAAQYLSKTVMLAAALFFVGTSSRFDSRRIRLYSFLFGSAIFLYAFARLLLLPVAS